MKCPKCSAICSLTHKATHDGSCLEWDEERQGFMPASPFDGPLPVFGTPFRELWTCSTHGEFGMKDDGSAEFVEPDAWVLGPKGEKLFRL